uniref:CWC25 spliceosome-associated protein n=1 Tax=Jaculus jaculus TaxID=51337 RepID=A0A8C5K2P5_JACJA
WHPQTLRNVEKVWKAEQKHEAERKKIEELQRELREERAREEMQRYAEDVGAVKDTENKRGRETENGCIRASSHCNDLITSTSLLQMSLDKKEKKKKKEKRKKHRKHRHRSSSSSRSSSEDEHSQGRSQRKVANSFPVVSRAPGYGLQVRDSDWNQGLPDPLTSHQRGMKNCTMSRSSSHSPPRHASKKSSKEVGSRDRRSRSPGRRSRSPRLSKVHNSKVSRKERGQTHSPSPKKEVYQRRHAPGYTRKLSAEELERKRQEMMENAKWREEERLNLLKRHAKEEEREQRLEKLDSRDGKFIHRMKLESASTSSLEDRVKRNIHSLQRTSVALEKNFMKR